jgi:hypothetical protein
MSQAVTVVQRAVRGEDPAGMMLKLGFGPLILITNFTVKMSGEVVGVGGWDINARQTSTLIRS